MLVQAATGDARLVDAKALAAHAQDHGVDARLELYPVQAHAFQLFWSFLPEAADAIRPRGRSSATRHRAEAGPDCPRPVADSACLYGDGIPYRHLLVAYDGTSEGDEAVVAAGLLAEPEPGAPDDRSSSSSWSGPNDGSRAVAGGRGYGTTSSSTARAQIFNGLRASRRCRRSSPSCSGSPSAPSPTPRTSSTATRSCSRRGPAAASGGC